jgi:RimJ/RimL family protein N-acetyltransferase
LTRLLYQHDAEVIDWVCQNIPHLAERIPYFDKGAVLGPAVGIGVLDDAGSLIAGVVFHGYDPFVKAMEVSCASTSRMWAKPDIVREILRYPFEQLQLVRVSAATPKRSTSPRRFLEGLGFKREGSLRKGFVDDAAIVYGLLAEDWAAHPINRGRAPSAPDCECAEGIERSRRTCPPAAENSGALPA